MFNSVFQKRKKTIKIPPSGPKYPRLPPKLPLLPGGRQTIAYLYNDPTPKDSATEIAEKTPTEIEEKKFMRRHFSSPRQIVDEMSCRDPAAAAKGQRHRCHRMKAKYQKIIKRLSKSMEGEVWGMEISLVLNYFFFHPQSGNDK